MIKKFARLRVALCGLLFLLTATMSASAHEKWFHETTNYVLRWDLFFRPLPLAFVGLVLLATLIAGLYWRKRGRGFVPEPENFGSTDDRRAALYGLIPAILGIHVAVPLLVSGVQGELFTPNNIIAGRLDVCARFGADGHCAGDFLRGVDAHRRRRARSFVVRRNFSRRT